MSHGLAVSVPAVRQHVAFLETVHNDPLNHASALYLDRHLLAAAVERYEKLWLPMVESLSTSQHKTLVPPIDVAWVWHLHRLAPLKYAVYCRQRFGNILDPGSSAFRLQSHSTIEDHDDPDCLQTRALWTRKYPDDPFFIATGGLTSFTSGLVEAIVATSERQRTFLWQVSDPHFSDELFLEAAIDRYDKFLRLMGTCGDRNFYVPSYDVDLCWHTHMLASCSTYHEETRIRAGAAVDHDDSVNDRCDGSKLNLSWANTKMLWRQVYGSAEALDAPRTCYRGEPPRWWWFGNRRKGHPEIAEPVVVLDDFVAEDLIKKLLAQLPDESTLDNAITDPQEMHICVPSSLHQRVLSVLADDTSATTEVKTISLQSAGESDATVIVPAKVSKRGVAPHKDRFANSDLVEGFVAVVYLTGGGTMTLFNQASGHSKEVDIQAGRMIAWDNTIMTHKVDASGTFRALIGTTAVVQPACACLSTLHA